MWFTLNISISTTANLWAQFSFFFQWFPKFTKFDSPSIPIVYFLVYAHINTLIRVFVFICCFLNFKKFTTTWNTFFVEFYFPKESAGIVFFIWTIFFHVAWRISSPHHFSVLYTCQILKYFICINTLNSHSIIIM